ncbi:uncharacterized protein EV422DRAFT_545796 [Fimicolochytrium jonesii]|uniref:uncharacterized protein n=1 Tax=Fimicolochytrium jonesii TaxID=1396493 RepID=UPI0022FE379F|nr:uncharacterized protein EV422DRAFT_545796 [Fimicolochytrium jonesii]KAI8816381.1 hypothetical protein EV422DRAFT_545796 [Fimicolochytrium jonesii]
MSDSEDDVPLLARRSANKPTTTTSDSHPQSPAKPVKDEPAAAAAAHDDESESEIPLAQRKRALSGGGAKTTTAKRGKKVVESDSDSDVPLAKRLKKEPAAKAKTNGTAKTTSRKRTKADVDSDTSDAATPEKKPRKSSASTKKKASKIDTSITPVVVKEGTAGDPAATGAAKKKAGKKGAATKDEEDAPAAEEEDDFSWLDNMSADNSIKWKSLQHNGPLFPPPYEPHGVQMKYDGQPVELSPDSEEVATFYAGVMGTDWDRNPKFRQNFFKDFLAILAKDKKKPPIKKIEKCDFSPLAEYLAQEKERKKNMSKEEKQKIKEEKAALDEKYGIAYVDSHKEKVGNYRIEPPGLFRGRGEHPKTGSLKTRVLPEQVTINIGEDAKVPDPPAGHKWGKVIHDPTVTWLATWKENVNDNTKYVFLSVNSRFKVVSDRAKFDKARELKKKVHEIRKDYMREMKDKEMGNRQRATAMYLIDQFALRAGNEKGEDEADTVGCCSLRYEHVILEPPNKIHLDFLGKDSIRFSKCLTVEEDVFKNIKIFKKPPKKEGDDLFDRLTTASLNKHLTKYMPGLTAKVFRTHNASATFQLKLNELTPADGTISQKLYAFTEANRLVAVLCNHQKGVAKNFGEAMARSQNAVLGVKYERSLVKAQLLDLLDAKSKKKRPELSEAEEGVTPEFIKTYLAAKEEKEKVKLEKMKAENKEVKVKKEAPAPTVERLEKMLVKLNEQVEAKEEIVRRKDMTKDTALGTSKTNYLDPRITFAWCSKHGVPVAKVLPQGLRVKFKWAEAYIKKHGADWQF